MEFLVNNNKLDITLENEKTVGDVLRSFEIICEEQSMATIGVNLNDKDINEKEFDSILNDKLKDNTKISLTVVSCSQIDEAFKTLSLQFAQMAQDLTQVPALLQTNGVKAHDIIKQLTDNVDFLCHTITLSSLFPQKYHELKIANIPLKDFFAQLSPVLVDLEAAMLSNDTVTVGDLAEYEISPKLKLISEALKSL